MPAPAGLKLLGTIAGDAAVALAVIDVGGGMQDIYRIGDSVTDMRLGEIGEGHVVLTRGGERLVLELLISPRGTGLISTSWDAGSVFDTVPTDAIETMGPNDYVITKRALFTRIESLERVLKAAKLTPYVEDGETKGLRITGIERMSLAAFIGLREGDVIQNVNGQNLTSVNRALQIYRKQRNREELDIRLLRDGRQERLHFRLK